MIMWPSNFRIAYVLSVIILILTIAASAGGLFLSGLYRDNEAFKQAWMGNDMVTLCIVAPMLCMVLYLSRQGSQRAQLIWAGLLGYLLYNYAFYLFGTAFNSFFLLYVSLFTLAAYALILVLSGLDVKGISQSFSNKTPVKAIIVFMVLMALPLLFVEGGQAINFVLTGELPRVPTLIFALDLSFVVPNMLLAAFLLWRRYAWGYIVGAVMLVKGVTYGLVLIMITASAAGFSLSGHWDPLMPFYLFVCTGSLAGCCILLRNLQPQKYSRRMYDPQSISMI